MPATASARRARKAFRKAASAAAVRSWRCMPPSASPASIFVEAVEMPDGAEFLTIARTLEGPQGAFNERPRRTALLLGCDIGFKDEIVYGEALPGCRPARPASRRSVRRRRSVPPAGFASASAALPRAEPPVTRPLGLDEMVTGLSAFDFQ